MKRRVKHIVRCFVHRNFNNVRPENNPVGRDVIEFSFKALGAGMDFEQCAVGWERSQICESSKCSRRELSDVICIETLIGVAVEQ